MSPVYEMTIELDGEGGSRQTKPSTERVLTHKVSKIKKEFRKVDIFDRKVKCSDNTEVIIKLYNYHYFSGYFIIL